MNTLGLNRQAFLQKLKVYALAHPVDYSNERQEIFTQVVTGMVEINHEVIWSLLSSGTSPDGKQIVEFGGQSYKPNLEDQTIAQISNSFAKTILAMWEKVFEEVLPDSFANAADRKMGAVNVGGAGGGADGASAGGSAKAVGETYDIY